jgi:hypothetical protein
VSNFYYRFTEEEELRKIIIALIAVTAVTHVALADESVVCKERANNECKNSPELVTTTFEGCVAKRYALCIAEKFQPNPVK